MSAGTTLPHVLVVHDFAADPGDREWEIEHPDGCPVEVYCGYEWVPWLGLMPYRSTHLACYVQYEVDANGIDGLADENGREWRTWTYAEGHDGLDKTLPPGRYLIEGWWHDGAGMGEYGGQGDADGRLTLLGPVAAPSLPPHTTAERGEPRVNTRERPQAGAGGEST